MTISFQQKPLQGAEGTSVQNADGNTLIKGGGSSGTDPALTALTARVDALEALLFGLTRQTVDYCDGSSPASKTILMS